MLFNYLKKAQTWLFPAICAVCGKESDRDIDLCQYCEPRLPVIEQACRNCGKHITADNQILTCGQCLKQTPAFERLYTLFQYEEPINHLIRDIKFNSKLAYARLFGELITNKIKDNWYKDQSLPELIIPVPLHKQRLRERGFNQALEIAQPIVKELEIPIDYNSCRRAKATQAQSELPANKRYANVRNAFIVSKTIKAKHIAIIDDVVTTSHTVNELSRALKLAGIEKIDIWCCGRALKA